MAQQAAQARQTKYCDAIEVAIAMRGHATNAELIALLRKQFPDVSATTVHRASARLAERGVIAVAPATKDGSMRYDANVQPHDHFMCSVCDAIRDTDIKDKVTPVLEAAIEGCNISGRLTISGLCKQCS
jgi:Fur family transcriptional regulator, peroxide stress response regulator